MLIKKLD